MSKSIYTSEVITSITSDRIVDTRDSLIEDIPRSPIILRPLTQDEYQPFSAELFEQCDKALKDVLNETRFNSSFNLIDFYRYYESLKEKGFRGSMLKAFSSFPINSTYRTGNEGTNCVGMTEKLKKRLSSIGIEASQVPGATSSGFMSPEASAYIDTTHVLLVVPVIDENKRGWIVLDPGYVIPVAMYLDEETGSPEYWQGNRVRQVRLGCNINPKFPYSICLGEVFRDKTNTMEIGFNPYCEILNPDKTVAMDVLRCSTGGVLATLNLDRPRKAVLSVDYLKKDITIKLDDQLAGKYGLESFYISFTFEELDLMTEDLRKKLESVFLSLDLPLEEGYSYIHLLVRYRNQYMAEVYPPSVRSKLFFNP